MLPGQGPVLRAFGEEVTMLISPLMIRDVGLDQFRQKHERFLPAEIAGFRRNHLWDAFLHDIQLGPDRYLLQSYGHLKFPWQIRVVEFVRVAKAFVRHQLQVRSAKGMALSCGEVSERHLVGAADLGFQVVNLAGEPIWRKPFGHRVGVQERPIDFLWSRAQHAMKPDGVCWHNFSSILRCLLRG